MRASSASCRSCSARHAVRSRAQASATGPDRNCSRRRLVSARRSSARCSAYSATAHSPPHSRASMPTSTLIRGSSRALRRRHQAAGAICRWRDTNGAPDQMSAALPSPSDMPRSSGAPRGTRRQGDACDRPAQASQIDGLVQPAGACRFADDRSWLLQVRPERTLGAIRRSRWLPSASSLVAVNACLRLSASSRTVCEPLHIREQIADDADRIGRAEEVPRGRILLAPHSIVTHEHDEATRLHARRPRPPLTLNPSCALVRQYRRQTWHA